MLKQKFAVQFGTNLIVKFITMLAGFFVARFAGPTVLGTISYGSSFVSIWLFLTTMFSAGHIKLISEGQNKGNCITTYTYLKFMSVVLFVIVVIICLIISSNNINMIQIKVILLLLFSLSISQIYNILYDSFTAMLLQAKANIINICNTLIFHIGRIIIVILGARAVGLAIWQLIAIILLLPLAYKMYKELPKGKWDKNLAIKYFYFGWPMLFVYLIESLINNSDKLILAHFTSVEELGYYAAALSLAGSIFIISNTVGIIFFPLFSNYIKERKWNDLNIKNNTYQTFNILFVFPIILLLIIIAKPLLLTLLGLRYESSIIPFQIITLATFFVITGLPYGNIIMGMGKFYINVLISAIQLIIFILSLFIFVSPNVLNLGAIGLALNLAVGYLYRNIAYIIISNKLAPLHYDWNNAIKIAIIIISSIIFIYISNVTKLYILYRWIFIIPLYIIFIYLILYISGLLKKEHIIMLLDMMNINKLFVYINEEL